MHSDASDGKQAAPPMRVTMSVTVAECHAVIEAPALDVAHLGDQMA